MVRFASAAAPLTTQGDEDMTNGELRQSLYIVRGSKMTSSGAHGVLLCTLRASAAPDGILSGIQRRELVCPAACCNAVVFWRSPELIHISYEFKQSLWSLNWEVRKYQLTP